MSSSFLYYREKKQIKAASKNTTFYINFTNCLKKQPKNEYSELINTKQNPLGKRKELEYLELWTLFSSFWMYSD